jgi:nucleoside-triphosphatase THEP1
MKIAKIDIPKSVNNSEGLDHIKMDKLGSIVLLTGKNGSGKTRILNKIVNELNIKPKKSMLANIISDINNIRNNRKIHLHKITELNNEFDSGLSKSQSDQVRKELKHFNKLLA